MGCGASSSPDDIIVVRGAPTSGKVAQSKLLAVVPDRGATDRSGHGASEVKEIEVSTGVFSFLVGGTSWGTHPHLPAPAAGCSWKRATGGTEWHL